MASTSGASSHTHLLLLLLLLLLLFMSSISAKVAMPHETASEPMAAMKPVSGMKSVLLDGPRRRRLNSFRICALCTCCGGSRGLCLPSPCCYAINCNIPNRPFGFCSFTPQTCNCFGCHL
ncbi:hypothetical protein COCNU_contig68928608G000010 [Cocos nucifera]|nr:hypothetical protein [Cocos nucifera]